MRTIKRDIVSAVIVSKDNKILMGKGRPGSVYQDCMLIPGGGMEEGETKAEALIREVMEETGVDISSSEHELVEDGAKGTSEKTLSGTDERVMVDMNFYTYRVHMDAPAVDISIIPGDDMVGLEWVDAAELNKHKLSPPSEELFKRLGYIS